MSAKRKKHQNRQKKKLKKTNVLTPPPEPKPPADRTLRNYNHPKKGAKIRTDPIRSVSDIRKIVALLKDKPRDSAIFIVGIHTNLRAADLVALTVGQVEHLKPGDELTTKEKKTSRYMVRTVSEPVVRAIQRWLAVHPFRDDPTAPLFVSQGGLWGRVPTKKPLASPTLSSMVKLWCKNAGIKNGNYSSHSLRKTFAFHALNTFKQPAHLVSAALGHKELATTLTYLGIQDTEIRRLFMNKIVD